MKRLIVLAVLILVMVVEGAVMSNDSICRATFMGVEDVSGGGVCAGAGLAFMFSALGIVIVLVSYVISYDRKLARDKKQNK